MSCEAFRYYLNRSPAGLSRERLEDARSRGPYACLHRDGCSRIR